MGGAVEQLNPDLQGVSAMGHRVRVRRRAVRWFQPPGVAERMLLKGSLALFPRLGGPGADRNTDPHLRQADRRSLQATRPC